MDELMRAYGQTLDELKLMRRLAHNTTMVVEIDGEISRISHALSAYVAEIQKRREADGVLTTPLQRIYHRRNRIEVVCNETVLATFTESGEDRFWAQVLCDALRAHYGYDAQGNDMLEGMGV